MVHRRQRQSTVLILARQVNEVADLPGPYGMNAIFKDRTGNVFDTQRGRDHASQQGMLILRRMASNGVERGRAAQLAQHIAGKPCTGRYAHQPGRGTEHVHAIVLPGKIDAQQPRQLDLSAIALRHQQAGRADAYGVMLWGKQLLQGLKRLRGDFARLMRLHQVLKIHITQPSDAVSMRARLGARRQVPKNRHRFAQAGHELLGCRREHAGKSPIQVGVIFCGTSGKRADPEVCAVRW